VVANNSFCTLKNSKIMDMHIVRLPWQPRFVLVAVHTSRGDLMDQICMPWHNLRRNYVCFLQYSNQLKQVIEKVVKIEGRKIRSTNLASSNPISGKRSINALVILPW
jgi:hypothetical protein